MTSPSAADQRPGGVGLWAAWLSALALAGLGVYFAIPWYALELETADPGWRGIWESLWPILAGFALLYGGHRLLFRFRERPLSLPPGDIVVPLGHLADRLRPVVRWATHAERWRINFHPLIERWGRSSQVQRLFIRGEALFRRKEAAGFLMMLFVLTVWVLLTT